MLSFATRLTMVFLLFVSASSAQADAVHVPLDGSAGYDPADFGYTVRVSTNAKTATIELTLTPQAAKAYFSTDLTLTHDGHDIIVTKLGLIDNKDGSKTLRIALGNTDMTNGGTVIIWSGAPNDKAMNFPNFGGFRLSIEQLLARPVQGQADQDQAGQQAAAKE